MINGDWHWFEGIHKIVDVVEGFLEKDGGGWKVVWGVESKLESSCNVVSKISFKYSSEIPLRGIVLVIIPVPDNYP